MKPLSIAVIGATGLVGDTVLRVLEQRRLPVDQLHLFASERSSGARIHALGRETVVSRLDAASAAQLRGIDLAFFAAGAQVSKEYAPRLAAQGAIVIDKSTAFRLDPDVPLVVPEVNAAIRGEAPGRESELRHDPARRRACSHPPSFRSQVGQRFNVSERVRRRQVSA